ncbi:Methanogenesis regulatory histidine kinase FilI [Candidatus Gugararchaeum adminiculabundum]|nr:Methanogenesis regulatory histidine kinase FilI [Candidatus Gugararchaeum adminiculabundum]
MKLSIRLKVLALVLGVILLVVLVTSLISFTSVSGETKKTVVEKMSYECAEKIKTVDRMMFERLVDIEMLSSPQNHEMSSSEHTLGEKMDYLRALERNVKSYASISIYDADGIRIGDTRGVDIGLDESSKPFVIEALNGNVYYSPEPAMSQSLGIEVIYFSAPLRDENGTITGVVATRMPITKITEVLGAKVEGQQVEILNAENELIFATNPQEHAGEKDYPVEVSKTLREGKEFIGPYEGEDYVIVGANETGFLDYKGSNWLLIEHMPQDVAFATVAELQTRFLLIALVLIIIALPVSLLVSNYFTTPILKLSAATEEVEKGNYTARVDIRTNDEMEQLGNEFNSTIERLEKIDAEHKQLEKAKTEFMSITSHELRSPMTPMKAQLQMLMEGYFGELDKKQKESLDIVLRNTDRLDHIVLDLLEISRIEAARLKFNFIETSLNPYIERLVSEMDGFMPEKKIEIALKAEKLPVMSVDPDRVMQVLRNLLNNAKKFSNESSKIQVAAELTPERDEIQFSVKDSGVGIPLDQQKRVFEPFFQADNTLSRKFGGTGLGLAICKGIVEAQNGKIWFESKPGKGATFWFTLPLKPTTEIKPITLLFSRKAEVEQKVQEIFLEFLGPLGNKEFERIRSRAMDYNAMAKYVAELEKQGVLAKGQAEKMKAGLARVLGNNP